MAMFTMNWWSSNSFVGTTRADSFSWTPPGVPAGNWGYEVVPSVDMSPMRIGLASLVPGPPWFNLGLNMGFNSRFC